MVTISDLENLLNKYIREGEILKADALYLWSLSGELSEQKTFELKYKSIEKYNQALTELKTLIGKTEVSRYDKTEDTQEFFKDAISSIFEKVVPPQLHGEVVRRLDGLSPEARRLAFLLYHEGRIISEGRISFSDIDIDYTLGPAYKVLFQEDFPAKALDELIAAGLIVRALGSSRRHWWYEYNVPVYAREVWSSLPELTALPEIARKGEKAEIAEPYRGPVTIRGIGEYTLPGISFSGSNLENMVHALLLKSTDHQICQKPGEPLYSIHFDLWSQKDDKYFVYECKGPEYLDTIDMKDIRDFNDRVGDLRRKCGKKVEAVIINTGRFTPDQEEYLREHDIKKIEGSEIMAKLLGWGVVGIKLLGIPRLTLEEGIFMDTGKLRETIAEPDKVFKEKRISSD